MARINNVAFRYVVSGVLSGIPFLFIVWLLNVRFELNYEYSTLLAYIVTVPLAYVLHRRFTFQSIQKVRTEFAKFVITGAGFFAVSLILRNLNIETAPTATLLMVTWIAMALINYIVYRTWVFD